MRRIDLIIIHASETRLFQNFSVEDLEACHKARGFKTAGYHFTSLRMANCTRAALRKWTEPMHAATTPIPLAYALKEAWTKMAKPVTHEHLLKI